MDEQDRDIFTVTDDDGVESTIEVIDYFFYNGEEYAVLCDYEENPDEDSDQEIFFMKVTSLEGDEVEFNPVDEDLSEQLFEAYTAEEEDEEEAEEGESPDEE